MRITCRWYDENQTILYIHYGKGWTHQDVYRAFSDTFEMLETVNHVVDIVVELSDQVVPSNALSMTGTLKSKISTNQRRTYFVGANTFIRILIRAASVAVPVFEHITFCSSVDEAFQRLNRDRDAQAAHAAVAAYRSTGRDLD